MAKDGRIREDKTMKSVSNLRIKRLSSDQGVFDLPYNVDSLMGARELIKRESLSDNSLKSSYMLVDRSDDSILAIALHGVLTPPSAPMDQLLSYNDSIKGTPIAQSVIKRVTKVLDISCFMEG
jgi:hypothetical protein